MSTIIVGVSGSAACFKAVTICSELAKRGHLVQAVLTTGATKLVQPVQFSCVTGNQAVWDEWQPQDPSGMDHISLAREGDILVVVPATADRISQLAHGLAGDLLGSLSLAFERGKPRMFVPAMNPEMWNHSATQRNVSQLEADGWKCIGPVEGSTACGEEGEGRMVEASEVVEAIEQMLAS